MEEQTDTKAIQPSATLGLLLAPLAVLLALATTRVVGIDYDLSANNMMPMLVVAIASHGYWRQGGGVDETRGEGGVATRREAACAVLEVGGGRAHAKCR